MTCSCGRSKIDGICLVCGYKVLAPIRRRIVKNTFFLRFESVPSLNSSKGRSWHWHNAVRDQIYTEIEAQLRDKTRMKRCRIIFTEHSDKPSDYGNLAWGLKYPLDAVKDQYSSQFIKGTKCETLTSQRLIPDDDTLHVVECRLERIKVNSRAERHYVFTMEAV